MLDPEIKRIIRKLVFGTVKEQRRKYGGVSLYYIDHEIEQIRLGRRFKKFTLNDLYMKFGWKKPIKSQVRMWKHLFSNRGKTEMRIF